MTYSDVATTGRGELVFLLEVPGTPYVFATRDYTPGDTWYTDAGYEGVLPWLDPRESSFEHLEEVKPEQGELSVSDIRAVITDVGGGLTAMFGHYRAAGWCRLLADLSASGTSLTVARGLGLPAGPGVCYLGQEAIRYSVRADAYITVATGGRGAYGSTARAYLADPTASPPVAPVVAAKPKGFEGRRCRLHAAVIDPATGEPGATEVIYRGRIGEDLYTEGGAWYLPISHVSKVLKGKVCQRLPSSRVRPGYWYQGVDAGRSTIYWAVRDESALTTTAYSATIAAGRYETPDELATAIWDVTSAAGSGTYPKMERTGDKFTLRANASTNRNIVITVRQGDPLWALGLKEGTYYGETNTLLEREADDDPRLLVIDLSGTLVSTVHPEIEVDDAEVFEAGLKVMVPGHCYEEVYSASGTTVTLAREGWGGDRDREADGYISVEDEEDLTLSHVWAFSAARERDTVVTAAKALLHLETGQPEPEYWAALGIEDEDVDWDELDAALEGAPPALLDYTGAVVKVATWDELVGRRLGLLGVCPRITDEGKIGWGRLSTPMAALAHAVPFDSSIWEMTGAPRARAAPMGALLNQVRVKHSYDYRTDKWPEKGEATVNFDDGVVELCETRSLVYEARGLGVSRHIAGGASTVSELEATLAHRLLSLFDVYGRNAPTIDIAATWVSRQYRCLDVVLASHDCAPDLAEGAIGITDRPAVVLARTHAVNRDGPDSIKLLLPGDQPAGPIAFCVLAEAWDSGNKRLTASNPDTYAATGDQALDYLEAGQAVRCWAYNAASGGPWDGTVVSVDAGAGTIDLAGDPFSGAFPADGVLVVYAPWDSADDDQKEWLYVADYAYELGAGGDEAKVVAA